MATLSVANVRKHSNIKTTKFAESDEASKRSFYSGASKVSAGEFGSKKATTDVGSSKVGNRTSGLSGIMKMKRRLNQWRANRLFSWNMASGPIKRKPLENTFKLDPEDESKFCPERVQSVMEDVLQDMLQYQKGYDVTVCATMSKCISENIKARVKGLGYQRYKLVVHVLMIQDSSQGLEVASRCVWDNNRDNSATAMYKNGDLVVVANVFGTYFE